MTNSDFKSLAAEERLGFFKGLSTDEVESLTAVQKAAYDEWKNGSVSASSNPESAEEAAVKFFDENPSYHLNSVFVSNNGVVFHGDIKGENACSNYCKQEGVEYKEYFKK